MDAKDRTAAPPSMTDGRTASSSPSTTVIRGPLRWIFCENRPDPVEVRGPERRTANPPTGAEPDR
jgi:hypothetical protein